MCWFKSSEVPPQRLVRDSSKSQLDDRPCVESSLFIGVFLASKDDATDWSLCFWETTVMVFVSGWRSSKWMQQTVFLDCVTLLDDGDDVRCDITQRAKIIFCVYYGHSSYM